MLAAEVGASGLMESVLVGFDSCGASAFLFLWFLWWRLVLVVDKLFDHERKRKKKMLVEEEGGVHCERKKKEVEETRRTKIGLSEK